MKTYSIEHPENLKAMWQARAVNMDGRPHFHSTHVYNNATCRKALRALLKKLAAFHNKMGNAIYAERYKGLFDEDSQITLTEGDLTVKVRKAGGYFYVVAY